MGYISRVEVVDPFQDLVNELGGLILTQRLLLGQKVKELSSRHPAATKHTYPVSDAFVITKGYHRGIRNLPETVLLNQTLKEPTLKVL